MCQFIPAFADERPSLPGRRPCAKLSSSCIPYPLKEGKLPPFPNVSKKLIMKAHTGITMPKPHHQYDINYKNLFSDPDMVASLLRSFAPADVVAEMDFSSLEPYPTSISRKTCTNGITISPGVSK